jgi:hypothetical protein
MDKKILVIGERREIRPESFDFSECECVSVKARANPTEYEPDFTIFWKHLGVTNGSQTPGP